MKNQKFETVINNNEELNTLLNEKDITGFSDFSKVVNYGPEFKDYIQNRYVDAFKLLYVKYTVDSPNDAKSNALLRSLDFLATDETINTITNIVNPKLTRSVKLLKSCKELADENITTLSPKAVHSALNNTVINICNKLDRSEIVREQKTSLISYCLYLSEAFQDLNPRHYKKLYDTHKFIDDKLKKIESYKPHEKIKYLPKKGERTTETKKGSIEAKEKKKPNYVIIIIVIIAVIALKMCARL